MSTTRHEIINLQVGQAGNQVGGTFWERVVGEHGLDNSGNYQGSDIDLELERIGVYFKEVEVPLDGVVPVVPRYVPRSIQIGMQPGIMDDLRNGNVGSLFAPNTFVMGNSASGGFGGASSSSWASGFYSQSTELVDCVLEQVNRQAEQCDYLQGFQMIHSLGGGTGSGFGTLLLSKLKEEYPDRMLATFSIVPARDNGISVVEPYNFLLSAHQLLETSDLTTCIDNEALYDIVTKRMGTYPVYNNLNLIIANMMCGISTGLRFPGQLNGDLRKLAMNLVPFPRLHFLLPSQAPLYNAAQGEVPERLSAGDLAAQFSLPFYFWGWEWVVLLILILFLFEGCSTEIICFARYLAAAAIFRGGNVSSREGEMAILNLQDKDSLQFIEWVPDNVSVSVVSVPTVGYEQSGTCLANSTSMQDVFKRGLDGFVAMYSRKAFMHWYTHEGMDEQEFAEAEASTRDLIAEYQQYSQGALAQDEEGEVEYGE